MTTHTFTDAELAARDAATRDAALAEAVSGIESAIESFKKSRREMTATGQADTGEYFRLLYKIEGLNRAADIIRALATTPPVMVCVPKIIAELGEAADKYMSATMFCPMCGHDITENPPPRAMLSAGKVAL